MSPYFGWLKYLSFFNYALEALLVNEMLYLQLVEERYGLNIDVSGESMRLLWWVLSKVDAIGPWCYYPVHLWFQRKELLARRNTFGKHVLILHWFCFHLASYLCQGKTIDIFLFWGDYVVGKTTYVVIVLVILVGFVC